MQTTMMLASFGVVMVSVGLVAVSVLLIGLILLQKNRGSGLSGAFGGVGGHTAFGTKTGDFLTWVTVGLTAVFLLLSIVGNYVFEQPTKPAATPAAPATPGPSGPGTPTPVSPAPVPATGQPGPNGAPQSGPPVKTMPIKVNPSTTP